VVRNSFFLFEPAKDGNAVAGLRPFTGCRHIGRSSSCRKHSNPIFPGWPTTRPASRSSLAGAWLGSVRNVTEPAQKRSGSSPRDQWWMRAWRMCENDAFAAIRFLLGWNCQSFGEGGVLHWRREAPHAGAGPILFTATRRRKGWGLYSKDFLPLRRKEREEEFFCSMRRKSQVHAIRREDSFFRGAWGSFSN
jgi:hypothetical protein